MKIIVTGSLGNIGKPLTIDLVKQGHKVTVITSKPEKKKEIEALGASAVAGSVQDAGFLTSVFTGAGAIYLMVPPDYGAPDSRAYYDTIGKSYVQAIQKSGVKRVVHLSSIGADLDKGTGFILGSHDTEVKLNALPDVAVTHLRAGYFYTNLLSFAGMIKGLGFIATNYGDNDTIVFAHPTDIAAAAAEELVNPGAGKKVRYVLSDEKTSAQVAQILGNAIGKPDLKWHTSSNEEMRQGMEHSGLPPQTVAKFVEMGDSMHTGVLYGDYRKTKPPLTGKIKIEDFAKEFAAAY